MNRRTVLVVDDEIKMQRLLEIMLQDMGHNVLRAGSGHDALAMLERESVDLVITDLRMPGMDGLTLLSTLHAQGRTLPTIMITAHGNVETAVAAMKYGAIDFILRPFEIETVEIAVARALNLVQVQRENTFLRDEADQGWDELIGRSAEMDKLYRLIDHVSKSRSAVLIVGETGTGKELVARGIHRASGRSGLFVPINCAAIPASIMESELFGHVKGAFTGAQADRVGKFEVADGGTLFLDEVTEMPVELQAKLLRVLEESCIERLGSNRRIDIDLRVVAATNRDPGEAVRDGQLRKDVFYRLNVLRADVPPLRARRMDVPLLARHFLQRHASALGCATPDIEDAALEKLCAYDWPGNVRELDNVMERAMVLSAGSTIAAALLQDLSILPAAPQPAAAAPGESLALQPRVEALERELIGAALAATGDNKSRAARLLDISERSLWYKLKKYALG
ncbi:MAG: sigma-54-dependent Fis family transcriptional regulator [Gammaproteobacteria bacterium]|nr:sigma-54-dependent Fis family transcriptional regulator [Gammaproteobacteria bacterium]